MEQQQKEKIYVVLEESHNLQSHITSQFAELHQIFTEKERRVLADIREEEMKIRNAMEKRLQEIQANLNSIQKELSTLQEQIDQKDNGIFLKEVVGQRRRISDDIRSLSVTDGALPIEKINHHFVSNTLWRETCAIQRGKTCSVSILLIDYTFKYHKCKEYAVIVVTSASGISFYLSTIHCLKTLTFNAFSNFTISP
ncbi:E3 ubiquitin-protein ligase TRIM69-like [Amblyraja radiata]|uniref:E3 ubiquitin-protein ligase TRIM69-like n=1 Tax=Amblyraja radiata TaxID=386614 RepID=UPI00140372CF|nr:E3 ubiquitin-protein ligase TRIM69-like [Amblyraja radiata]